MKKNWRIFGATMAAVFVTLGGNLHTIYAFTVGYDGEHPVPFWQIMTQPKAPFINSNETNDPRFTDFEWNIYWDKDKQAEVQPDLKDRFGKYWYPNATRFIPFTIHEFPSYSFVVSDVHGHVLSLGLVLLAIALLIQMFVYGKHDLWFYAFYGLIVAGAFTTNASDGPIYLGLFGVFLLLSNRTWLDKIKKLALVVAIFSFATVPFLFSFKSFVSGLGVNCPPASLVNKKIGPFVFETTDKCQKSPLWMMTLLWGFGWYAGLWLLVKHKLISENDEQEISKTRFLAILFAVAVGLVIFPEFLYFKDIYPAHFRSNTMFKLGYQAFIWWGLIGGYVVAKLYKNRQWIFIATSLPMIFLVVIYPKFAIRSYFGELSSENYKGINGLKWMAEQYPGDKAAIEWLNINALESGEKPTVVEAVGESYTDYSRISTFTGLPSIVGWPVHEWLWRGSYDVAAPRIEEVRKIYESDNVQETKQILDKYGAKYIVVGQLETQKYPNLNEIKIATLSEKVFSEQGTSVYRVY